MGQVKEEILKATDGDIIYTVGNSTTVTLPSLAGNGTIAVNPSIMSVYDPSPEIYTCTLCKIEFTESEYIDITNFPFDRGIHYKGPQYDRHICSKCNCKALDKLYGIENAAEYTLYE